MSKPMKIMILGLVVVFGGIVAWNTFIGIMVTRIFSNLPIPTVTISATQATQQNWNPYLSAVGTITAVNGVDIATELSGVVDAIYFHSGESINADDLLVKLRDSANQADLKNKQAALRLAQLNYDRQVDLYQQRVTSSADLDKAKADLDQQMAEVESVNVVISKKHIKAPFSGRLGIRQVSLGEYLNAGDIIVTLQAHDPLFVEFSMPAAYIPNLFVKQEVLLSTDTYPDVTFAAKINAINSKVDVNSRNILVQATLSNEDNKLVPGMFMDVTVILPQQDAVIVVPATAIAYSLYGQSIFVIEDIIDEDSGETIQKAYRRYITVGEERDNKVVVLDGISVGDWVVTSGQHKLGEGDVPIAINNSVELN